MGSICSCTQDGQLKNDLEGSLLREIRKYSRFGKYDFDECNLSKLTRNNTRFIPIKPDQEDPVWTSSKKKKVCIEDFKFLKVNTVDIDLLVQRILVSFSAMDRSEKLVWWRKLTQENFMQSKF